MAPPNFDDLRTPCCNGSPIPLQLLQDYIEAGEDVNFQDDRPESGRLVGRWTLLHYAADTKDIRSIHILCDCGANVNARASDGQTPLHLAVDKDFTSATIKDRMPDSFPTAEALLRHGADDTIADNDGHLPIDQIADFPELVAIYNQTKQSVDGAR